MLNFAFSNCDYPGVLLPASERDDFETAFSLRTGSTLGSIEKPDLAWIPYISRAADG